MPVSTEMVWEVEDWEACCLSLFVLELSSLLADCDKAPPSRFRVSWILVSFVSRLMLALRTRLGVDIFVSLADVVGRLKVGRAVYLGGLCSRMSFPWVVVDFDVWNRTKRALAVNLKFLLDINSFDKRDNLPSGIRLH